MLLRLHDASLQLPRPTDRRTEGRRAGRTLLRLPRLLGSSLCSGCVSAPGFCSCSGRENSSRPRAHLQPQVPAEGVGGAGRSSSGGWGSWRSRSSAGRGSSGPPPLLLLSSFSSSFSSSSSSPLPLLPFSSPSVSSPPRESGSCTVHGGLGAWVLVPSGVTSPGDAAGAAAGAGSAPPHSLPHLAPKPCVCGGSAGAPEPSAGCKEGEPGAGPGAVRLKINTDSADPSIRKLDLSGTLLRTLLVQPSL